MFKVKEALNELFAEKLNDPLSKEGFVLKRRNAFQRKNKGHIERCVGDVWGLLWIVLIIIVSAYILWGGNLS